MKIYLENSLSKVEGTDSELNALEREYTIFRKNDFFKKRMNPFARVEPVRLFSRLGAELPTGLLPRIFKEFPGVEVYDKRQKPVGTPLSGEVPVTFKRFQHAAVDFLLHHGRAIVWCPTGTGKTFITGEAIRRLGLRTLYIVNTKSALNQIREKLSWIKTDIGICGDSKLEEGFITVATVQSVHKLPLHVFNVVVVSECHHTPAETYNHLLQGAHNAYYRFGETGSLTGRSDGLELLTEAALGSDIYQVPFFDLEVQELIPKVSVMLMTVPASSVGYSFMDDYVHQIVENRQRNAVIADVSKYFTGKTQLIYVDRLAHGHHLQEAIPGSIFVHGKTPTEERHALLEDMKGKVIITTDVFTESLDMPELDVIVNAAAMKSEINVLQLVGRGLRGGPDKTVYVIDFMDRDQGGVFERHSKTRKKAYKKISLHILESTVPVTGGGTS